SFSRGGTTIMHTRSGHHMQTGTMTLPELTVRYSVKKSSDGQPIAIGRMLNRPSDAAPALMAILQDEPAEVFAILCLTTKHRVIAYHEVSRGHARFSAGRSASGVYRCVARARCRDHRSPRPSVRRSDAFARRR